MVEEKQRTCTLNEYCRRFVVILVCVCILTGMLLLENERTLNSPHPKTVFGRKSFMFIFKNGSLSSARQSQRQKISSAAEMSTRPQPFNYQRTRQWGKLDKVAWKLYYGDFDCHENPRRRKMIAILRTWMKLVEKYDIEYAFYFGSLLGIVRNNDVNPWDHDMDVLVPYSDILKLEKAAWPRTNRKAWRGMTLINYIPNSQHNVSIDDRKRWDCDGQLVESHVDYCAIQEPLVRIYNSAVFLDVFSYQTKKDTIEFISEGRHHVIKKTDYFPLRPCLFMGFDGWCPNNPAKMLADNYGKHYMDPIKKCKQGQWI